MSISVMDDHNVIIFLPCKFSAAVQSFVLDHPFCEGKSSWVAWTNLHSTIRPLSRDNVSNDLGTSDRTKFYLYHLLSLSGIDTNVLRKPDQLEYLAVVVADRGAGCVRRYMNESLYMVQETFSTQRAYALFVSMGLRHMVVVDEVNRVRGIITRKDLMQKHLEQAAEYHLP